MIRSLRSQLDARQQGKADAAIRKLKDNTEVLGIGPVPESLCAAIKERYLTAPLAWAVMVPVAVIQWLLFYRLMNNLLVDELPQHAPQWLVDDLTGKAPGSVTSGAAWIQFARDWVLGISYLLIMRRTMVYLAMTFNLRAFMFERVDRWADLIGECAEVVRAPSVHERHHHGPSLRFAILRVRGAAWSRGTVRSFDWQRRITLRRHAFRVVAALREARGEFVTDPKSAAKRLGELTLTISERYVDRRVDMLLDEGDIGEAGRSRPRGEALQLAISAVLLAVIALVASAFHLPVPITMAAVVITVAVVYRSAVAAGLGVLAALSPLFFPGK
ncbi:hypothetical protein AB0B50_04040 [Streptomyces sp. NPDC041068]|uniref:hypothetical protein n=1 Tax=Streptomyces sp. NPDC041068 TaxID=3155130 RepID=UPI0034106060